MSQEETRKPLKIGRWLLIAAIFGAISGGVQRWVEKRQRTAPVPGVTAKSYPDSALEVRAPEGARIKVEVLNATRTRGLARRATQFLRDRGFDVVLIGTSPERREKTIVLDRSGHPDWAKLIGKSLNAPWEARPDTSRYLDATVLVGSDWSPPPEPFYP